MFKKALVAATLAACSFSSIASWNGGVSYINLSDNVAGIDDISLGGIAASIGYQINPSSNFIVTPSVLLGTGISDDSVSVFGVNVEIEMDSFIELSIRGQYEFENGVYLFAAPSYANLEVTASARRYSETQDEWEFGFGGGAGIDITDTASIEFTYSEYDSTDVLNIGMKFDF